MNNMLESSVKKDCNEPKGIEAQSTFYRPSKTIKEYMKAAGLYFAMISAANFLLGLSVPLQENTPKEIEQEIASLSEINPKSKKFLDATLFIPGKPARYLGYKIGEYLK